MAVDEMIEEPQIDTPDQQGDPVETYYNYLKKAGADVAPTLDSFKKTLSDDKTAQQYYSYLKTKGFDAPPTYDSFSKTLGIKKNAGFAGTLAEAKPPKAVSESTGIPKPQMSADRGKPTLQAFAEKHAAAQDLLHQELSGNNDIVPGIVSKMKAATKASDNLTNLANNPASDQPATGAQLAGQTLQASDKANANFQNILAMKGAPEAGQVSPEDVNAFIETAQKDPDAGRGFLQHISTEKPEKKKAIQAAMYTTDAANRISQEPDGEQKTGKILDNVHQIEKGNLTYNPQTGSLQKPENVWESIGTGLKAKNKAFDDYHLFNNASPGEAIGELEKRRKEFDPDEPIPVPAGLAGELSGGLASQPIKGLIAGKLAGAGTALIPGAEGYAPVADKFISAAVSSNDFRKITYAHSLQQNYNQLRNEGMSPEDAYHKANGQAKDESMVDAVAGAAMMYGAGAIGELKLPNFAAAEGFKDAVVTGLKQGAKGIGEAGAIGLLQGAAQDVKNQLSEAKGIQRSGSGEDIGEAMKSGAVFTLGLAALAKGMDVMSGITKNKLLNGLSKADPKQINEELGNQILEKHITPEEAQAASKAIEEHRIMDAGIPDNVTDESRLKIQDKIKRRDYLEMQLESADKAFHPEIKEKIKAVNEDILELAKDKKPKGEADELSVPQNVPREKEPEQTENQDNKEAESTAQGAATNQIPVSGAAPSISPGDVVTSPHFEGEQKVRSVSPDGASVFIEGAKDHHVHEIPVEEVTPSEKVPDTESQSTASEEPPGGNSEPPKDENPDDLPFGQLPVGISHEAQTDRAKAELNVAPPERGEGVTMHEAVQKGRDLIAGGTDPVQVVSDFKKTGKISMDDMSVVRAKYEQLAKITNDAYDKFGENSPEAKTAFKTERDWYNTAVKPMQTEWSKTGMAQQGATDVDTGTVMGIKRAIKERFDKDLNPAQLEKAKELAEKNKELNEQVSKLQKKLDEAHNEEPTKNSNKFAQKSKKVADAFRKLKTKEFTFRDSSGNEVPIQKMGANWNDLVELGAKAIEKTGEIADGVAAILDKVKESDWYNKLSSKDKDRFETELTDHYLNVADKKTASRIKALENQLADLEEGNIKEKGTTRKPTEKEAELKDKIFEAKNKLGLIKGKAMPKQPKTTIEPRDIAEKYVNKKDDVFTPDEAKEIWDYTKKKYLDQNIPFPQALRNVASDLGLNSRQILAAIATPKGAKNITLEMYRKQYERTRAINSANIFIKTATDSQAKRFFNKLPSIFFNLKTYGHGTVGFLTHAGPNIFRPSVWKAYWPNFFKQFSFAYGNLGKYQMALEGLKNSPHFDEWRKAGLAVDPQGAYDEYQLFGIKQSWLGEAGTRGFNALKFLRYDMAESFYEGASDSERADPQLRDHIAELVNHATGHSEIKVPGKIAKVFFAPGLEISRWQRMITDPAIALNTVRTWNKRTPAEQAAAKIVFRGAGEKLATYGVLLAANAGLLSALGSKQQVNTTDPSKSDWLKFKGGGETLDFTGGVLNPLRLLSIITKEAYLSAYGEKQDLRTKPGDKDASTLTSQARYKLSPIAASAVDLLTGTDAMGNPLPWTNIEPSKGRHKIDWTEFAWQQTPIPISAGAKAAMDGMRERGVSNPEINDIFNGLLHFTVEGFTGAKASTDYSLGKEGGSGGGGGAGGNFQFKEWK